MKSMQFEKDDSLDDQLKFEEWPIIEKTNLKKTIDKMEHQEEFYTTLLSETGWSDVTTNPDALKLAKEHKPEILLRGLDLRSEKKSPNWAGMVFRVITDQSEFSQSKKCVIQYVYIWTKQRFFLTLWNFILPIWILIAMSLYINLDIQFYKTNPELVELIGFEPIQMYIEEVLSYETRIWLIILLCVWFIIVGLLNIIYMLRDRIARPRAGYILFGGVFGYFHVMELLTKTEPFWRIRVGYAIDKPILTQFTVNIYPIPVLAFGISILAVIFLLLLPRIRKRVKTLKTVTHDMDYAPIFVYFERNTVENLWEIEEIRYDKFHYCVDKIDLDIEKARQKYLIMHKDEEGKVAQSPGRPIFAIDGAWHSFKPYTKRDKQILYGLCALCTLIFFSVVLLTGIGLYNNITLLEMLEQLPEEVPLREIGILLLHKLVYPSALIIPAYYVLTRLPTRLTKDEILEEGNYHLTETKLLKLWNLTEELARFSIRDKIQNPEPEITWTSFHNEDIEKKPQTTYLCGKVGMKATIRHYLGKNTDSGESQK